jgi:DEAD/DEAH box helicase domain-containing protein
VIDRLHAVWTRIAACLLPPFIFASAVGAQGIFEAVDSLRAAQTIGFTPTDRNALRYIGGDVPARLVSLRAIEPETFAIVDMSNNGATLETIEASKAFWEVYDGAIYLFQGRSYLCRRVDLSSRVAEVVPADVRYWTKVVDLTNVHVLGGNVAYDVPGADAADPRAGGAVMPPTSARSGPAVITLRFLGFLRVWRGSGIVFDRVNLFLPDVQFTTEAAYVRCGACAAPGLALLETLRAGLCA